MPRTQHATARHAIPPAAEEVKRLAVRIEQAQTTEVGRLQAILDRL